MMLCKSVAVLKQRRAQSICVLSGCTLFSTSACVNDKASAHSPKPLILGKMMAQREECLPYEPGQYFIHKVFGYRGVLLFPWSTEFSQVRKMPAPPEDNESATTVPVSPKTTTYYHALIDTDDLPQAHMSTESVVLSNGAVHSVRSFDAVAHDEVLPFTAAHQEAVTNRMIEHWFQRDQSPQQTDIRWTAKEAFNAWRQSCESRLVWSHVVSEESQGVRVTVMPFYAGRNHKTDGTNALYWWMYTVRIENLTDEALLLVWRDIKIYCSASYTRDSAYGMNNKAVPLPLCRRAYQHNLIVTLPACKGHVWGKISLQREDNSQFDVEIPTFHLEMDEDAASSQSPP